MFKIIVFLTLILAFVSARNTVRTYSQQPLIGGFQPMTEEEMNTQEFEKVVGAARKYVSQRNGNQLGQVQKATRQLVNGLNYSLQFSNPNDKYCWSQVHVYCTFEGQCEADSVVVACA